MLNRKKSYKGHTHNPKLKKYKHETTWEESFRNSLLTEFEQKFFEREKILQQKEHEFQMKQIMRQR